MKVAYVVKAVNAVKAVNVAKVMNALKAMFAFAFLNALLTFENQWPGFGVHLNPRLSFELCLAVLVLTGWFAWRGAHSGRPAQALLPARAATLLMLGFLLLVAVRYADVTAPAVLGRPVNLYWDGRHALELLRVAGASLSAAQVAGVLLGLFVALAVLGLLVRVAVVALARGLAVPQARWPVTAAVVALAASFMAYVPGQRDTRWFFALPLAPTVQHQAWLMWRVLGPAGGQAVLGPSPRFEGRLDGLQQAGPPADVLLMFAESYGASSFDLPAVASALAAERAALAQAIASSGRGVVTGRVRSPTFGGASWLAHASLLSGLPMADPGHHDLLLTSQRPTLVRHFAQQGYRTVGWMPGLKRAWPEGAFYGYARLADDAGVGYGGPDFGYWRIPDQAAMALLHEQELAPGARVGAGAARQPRFVVFATTSTHAPFHPLAPYVADWARLAGGRPGQHAAYTAADAAAAQAEPLALQQPLARYTEALRYQFRWWAGYLQQRAAPGLVWVILGDHQPPALVAGAGASWDVPVHVISSDLALLQRLQAQGFVSGLQLPAAGLGPMHELAGRLLRSFATAGAGDTAASAASSGSAASAPLRGPSHHACTSPEGASAGRACSHWRIVSAPRPCGCSRRRRSPSETA